MVSAANVNIIAIRTFSLMQNTTIVMFTNLISTLELGSCVECILLAFERLIHCATDSFS